MGDMFVLPDINNFSLHTCDKITDGAAGELCQLEGIGHTALLFVKDAKYYSTMGLSRNVQQITAESVDRSGLDLSLKTPRFHSHNGCTSSICGPLANLAKESLC